MDISFRNVPGFSCTRRQRLPQFSTVCSCSLPVLYPLSSWLSSLHLGMAGPLTQVPWGACLKTSCQVQPAALGRGCGCSSQDHTWSEATFAQPVPVAAAGAVAVSVIPHATIDTILLENNIYYSATSDASHRCPATPSVQGFTKLHSPGVLGFPFWIDESQFLASGRSRPGSQTY